VRKCGNLSEIKVNTYRKFSPFDGFPADYFKMTPLSCAKDTPVLGRFTTTSPTRFLNQGGLSRSAWANAHPEESIQ
jgi:hypothetical protein